MVAPGDHPLKQRRRQDFYARIDRPEVDQPALAWARGHYDSAHGWIEVAWHRSGEDFELDVTVPPNTSASVYVPAASLAVVTEGGKPVAKVVGIQSVVMDGDRAVVSVQSGSYRFKSKVR